MPDYGGRKLLLIRLCECRRRGTSVRVRIGTDLIFRGRVRAPRNSGNDLGIDHGIFQSRRTPDEPPFATNPPLPLTTVDLPSSYWPEIRYVRCPLGSYISSLLRAVIAAAVRGDIRP